MSPRRFSPCRRFALVVLFHCGCLVACVGAMRLPARSHFPTGTPFQASKMDMSFLESSAIQQKDVAGRLASIDTGYRDPHLFWGRWADSKWGYWWLLVARSSCGGGGKPVEAGNAKRIWHVKNLLITFDDKGAMQKREVIDDDRVIWRRLHEHVAGMPPLDLSQPQFLSVDSRNALPILLLKEYFEVTAPKRGSCAPLPRLSSSSRTIRPRTNGIRQARPVTPCILRRKRQPGRTSVTVEAQRK